MNPILLLHGALGSKTQLKPFKEMLELNGRKVYSLNFSGHSGEPFHNEFGIEVFTEDVVRFLHANSLSKVDIFGYSMGGYVAIWLAFKHPELVGKIITLGTKFDWSIDSAQREVKKLDPEKIQEKVPAFARVLENRHSPNDWKELLRRTSDMMMGLGQSPLLTEDILKNIRHEIFILLGDQDDMADRAYTTHVAEVLPNATFSLLDNTPHPIEKVNLQTLLSFVQ